VIVITCVATPLPGKLEEAVAEARALADFADSPGQLSYTWSQREGSDDIHLMEVYESSDAVWHHVRRIDFAPFAALVTMGEVFIYSDDIDPEIIALLRSGGQTVHHYTSV